MMKPGPLRQLAGMMGLLALTPTALLLAQGALSPLQAAVRAVVTLIGVVAVARTVAWGLAAAAGSMERSVEGAPPAPAAGAPVATPGRRSTDRDGSTAQRG